MKLVKSSRKGVIKVFNNIHILHIRKKNIYLHLLNMVIWTRAYIHIYIIKS